MTDTYTRPAANFVPVEPPPGKLDGRRPAGGPAAPTLPGRVNLPGGVTAPDPGNRAERRAAGQRGPAATPGDRAQAQTRAGRTVLTTLGIASLATVSVLLAPIIGPWGLLAMAAGGAIAVKAGPSLARRARNLRLGRRNRAGGGRTPGRGWRITNSRGGGGLPRFGGRTGRPGALGRAAGAHQSSRTGRAPGGIRAALGRMRHARRTNPMAAAAAGMHPRRRSSSTPSPAGSTWRGPRRPARPTSSSASAGTQRARLTSVDTRRQGRRPTVAKVLRGMAANQAAHGRYARAAAALAAAGAVGTAKAITYPLRPPARAVGRGARKLARWARPKARRALTRAAGWAGGRWLHARLAMDARGRVLLSFLSPMGWVRRTLSPRSLRRLFKKWGVRLGVIPVAPTPVETAKPKPRQPAPAPTAPVVVPDLDFSDIEEPAPAPTGRPAYPTPKGDSYDTAVDDDAAANIVTIAKPSNAKGKEQQVTAPVLSRTVVTSVPHPHQQGLLQANSNLFRCVPNSVPGQIEHLTGLSRMFIDGATLVDFARQYYVHNYPRTNLVHNQMATLKAGLIQNADHARHALSKYLLENPEDVQANTQPQVNESFNNVPEGRTQGVDMAQMRKAWLEAFGASFKYKPENPPDLRAYLRGLYPMFLAMAKDAENGAALRFPGMAQAVAQFCWQLSSGFQASAKGAVTVIEAYCVEAAHVLLRFDAPRVEEHLANVNRK